MLDLAGNFLNLARKLRLARNFLYVVGQCQAFTRNILHLKGKIRLWHCLLFQVKFANYPVTGQDTLFEVSEFFYILFFPNDIFSLYMMLKESQIFRSCLAADKERNRHFDQQSIKYICKIVEHEGTPPMFTRIPTSQSHFSISSYIYTSIISECIPDQK